MKECINGYTYDTDASKLVARAFYKDFPKSGDRVVRVLFQDHNEQYFVFEEFSWEKRRVIIPWQSDDAPSFVQDWAHQVFVQ